MSPRIGMSGLFITIPAGWLTTRSGYVNGRGYWDQIPRCSWPEETATKCPQVLNPVVHQHSASNVGGDTNQRQFCKKQSTFRISESLCCVNNGVVRFKFTKIK